MSTRPRIEFNKQDNVTLVYGWKKKNLDWSKRNEEFLNIIDETKNNSEFDCLVPVSGGKDGAVTHQLIHKYNLRPLCITVRPSMELEIGKKNLENFLKSGWIIFI